MKRPALSGPTLFDLVPNAPRLCTKCGGTILAPTIGGVPRGTCHCPENLSKEASAADRVTDWTAERIQVVKSDPQDCCKQVIAHYEGLDDAQAEIAKQRGGVALYCPTCKSRVTFTAGKWQREGTA